VCFLVNGYFVTVLYYPFFWINLAFTVALGAVAQRAYGRPVAAAGGRTKHSNLGPNRRQPVPTP